MSDTLLDDAKKFVRSVYPKMSEEFVKVVAEKVAKKMRIALRRPRKRITR